MNPVRHVVRWYSKQPSIKRTKIKAGLISLSFTVASGVAGSLYDSDAAKRISVVFGILAGLIALWVTIWEPSDSEHSPGQGSRDLRSMEPLSSTSRPGSPLSTVSFWGVISTFIPSLGSARGLRPRGITDPPHLLSAIDSPSIIVPYRGHLSKRPGAVETPTGSSLGESVIATGTMESLSSTLRPGSPSSPVSFWGAISTFIPSLGSAHGLRPRGITDPPHLLSTIDSPSIIVPYRGHLCQKPCAVESPTGSSLGESVIATGTQASNSVEGRNIRRRKTQPLPSGSRSSDIYRRCLQAARPGYPLWIPEPNNRLPVENQRKGLMIGDVGIMTNRGSYDSLFNVFLPRDHPLNLAHELPVDFTPLEITPGDIKNSNEFTKGSYLAMGSVISQSVHPDNSLELVFESSAPEGAIVVMPDGAESADLTAQSKLRRYLATHALEIYRYLLIQHGQTIRNGDLSIVVGFVKATTWGMAVISNPTSQEDCLLKFASGSWEYSGAAEVKTGPDIQELVALRMGDPAQDNVEYQNQCLFVRTLNFSLTPDTWQELLSEVGEVD